MTAAKRRGPVRRFFGALGRAFAIMVFIGIITGSIVVSVMALYVFNSLDDAPVVDLSNVEVNLNNTSYIYVTDPDTQEQTVVKELYSGQNREWVSYSEIPQTVIDVTVAAEDKRFWEHHGVDWLRTIRSTLGYFGGSSRIQGGSTITQQVIKNLTGNDEVTPERKVQEIFTALKLEKNYSKEQILETYLNVAFFSNQCYGIQSASKLYFNKDISELNVAEAATLIAITNAPTKYNPLRETTNEDYGWGTGMEENKERRDYILGEMLEAGTLTQSEYDQWINYDVQLAPREEVQATSDGMTALTDWHTDQVIEDVITAGTAVRETMPILKACADVQVPHMFISVDRCEVGHTPGKTAIMEVEEEFGVKVHPIVTVVDIHEYLKEHGTDPELLKAMEGYMEQYCVL